MKTPRITLSDLKLDQEDLAAVTRVIESGWLTMGPKVAQFEAAFADAIGVGHALAVANGTAALHLALSLLGLGPGDEVITTPITFVATANSILFTGATPVFADIIGPEDLNIDPERIEERITPKTRAIVVVHYGGAPCRMDRIMAIADRHGLPVIEDAAHAPGASYQGRFCGTWGALGCFSFYSNKNMTTGEGGMVVTNDPDLAARGPLLRSHGVTTSVTQRHQGDAFSYDVIDLGYNYRLDEIRAALGLAQLAKLPENNRRRQKHDSLYRKILADRPDLTLPFDGVDGRVCHIFPVILPPRTDRSHVMAALREQGVQTSIHYPPIHLFSYYRDRFPEWEGRLPAAEDMGRRVLTLPLYPSLTPSDIEYVCQALREVLDQK